MNPWTQFDPAVPLLDLSTFRKIPAKHQLISIILSVGPGSGIEKLRELKNSVVLFHLACKSVYDTTGGRSMLQVV